MADLRKVPVTWTTGAGGLGLSVFYSADPDDVTTELGTFFNAIKAAFPGSVTWSIPSSGDTIESTTGILTGAWTGGTAASITATGGTSLYAAGTGGYVRWQTPLVIGGRRLKGRTFLCPIITDQYATDGTLNSTTLSGWQTAATTLATSGKLVVWHRGTVDDPTGAAATVTAAVVPDKVTSLKTRRS